MVVYLENRGKPVNQRPCACISTLNSPSTLTISCFSNVSRSHMPEGVKTKTWEDRMEKTKKETAVKKWQAELKEEKQAEIAR